MTLSALMRAGAGHAVTVGAACAVLVLGQSPAHADDHSRRNVYAETVQVNRDLTYTMEWVEDYTLNDRQGVDAHNRAVEGFNAKAQTLELVEAFVTQPDGRRIDVDPDGIFTRPKAVGRFGPEFTDLEETTVYFPQLEPGSRTHVRWRLRQITPSPIGFNDWILPEQDVSTDLQSVDVTIPADIPLQWQQRGGFKVVDTTEGGIRHISAAIRNF